MYQAHYSFFLWVVIPEQKRPCLLCLSSDSQSCIAYMWSCVDYPPSLGFKREPHISDKLAMSCYDLLIRVFTSLLFWPWTNLQWETLPITIVPDNPTPMQSNVSPSQLPDNASYAPNGLHYISHIPEEVLMFVYLFSRALCSVNHVHTCAALW